MTVLDIRGNVVGDPATAIKAPCTVATTGSNITLSGAQAIDGVTVGNDSERVLVKDQTDPTQNGIYIASNGDWDLATDWGTNGNVVYGTMVLSSAGAVNAGILWVQVGNDNPIIIGTSDISFVNQGSLSSVSQSATSTSAVTIGTGSKTWNIQSGKGFQVSQWVLVLETSNLANQMLGQVVSYSGTTLVLNVVATGGSGTHSDWTVVLNNSQAAAGYSPPVGTGNVTGPGSSVASHLATFADVTGKLLSDGGVAGALANLSSVAARYLAASAVMFGMQMINGTIVPSVSGSALTFTVETYAGAVPSVADPVGFVFRDATLANGDYSVIWVTAALSTTIPSGSTVGSANATPFKPWVTAVNDAGTVSLAVINCFNATTNDIYPLSGEGVVTVAAYGAGANSVATFYGTAGHTNVPYSILGYATYETGSTLATAGTYATPPTRMVLYRPGVALPGAVVQTLCTTLATTPAAAGTYTPSSTAPTVGNAAAGPTQSVQPRCSANILRVRATLLIGASATAAQVFTAFLTQDSGACLVASSESSATGATTGPASVDLFYQGLANTIASTAFKTWAYSTAGVANINTTGGGSAFFAGAVPTYILVEEIAT